MTAGQLVTCETVAAIVRHVRRVADIPVKLGGHSVPRPRALCDRHVDWDTTRPVVLEHITCRACKAAVSGEFAAGTAAPPQLAARTKPCERCGVQPAIAGRPGPARCEGCAGTPPPPRKPRSRRGRGRARTIGRAELRRQVRLHAASNPAAALVERPLTRGECLGGARPCPWVGCRHHLYLDVDPGSGSIKLLHPDLEPWQLKESCSLDIADRGGMILEELGGIMNLTRERIRQVEVRGLLKIKMASPSPDEIGAALTGPAATAASEAEP